MNVREHVIDAEPEPEYCGCSCSNCSGCLGVNDASPWPILHYVELKPPGPPTGYDDYLRTKYGASE